MSLPVTLTSFWDRFIIGIVSNNFVLLCTCVHNFIFTKNAMMCFFKYYIMLHFQFLIQFMKFFVRGSWKKAFWISSWISNHVSNLFSPITSSSSSFFKLQLRVVFWQQSIDYHRPTSTSQSGKKHFSNCSWDTRFIVVWLSPAYVHFKIQKIIFYWLFTLITVDYSVDYSSNFQVQHWSLSTGDFGIVWT